MLTSQLCFFTYVAIFHSTSDSIRSIPPNRYHSKVAHRLSKKCSYTDNGRKASLWIPPTHSSLVSFEYATLLVLDSSQVLQFIKGAKIVTTDLNCAKVCSVIFFLWLFELLVMPVNLEFWLALNLLRLDLVVEIWLLLLLLFYLNKSLWTCNTYIMGNFLETFTIILFQFFPLCLVIMFSEKIKCLYF